MSAKNRNLLSAVLMLGVCGACDAGASMHARRHFVVGLPPHMDQTAAKDALQAARKLLLRAAPGDRVGFFDAYNMRKIAACEIANGSDRARALKLKSVFAALNEHIQNATADAGPVQNQVRAPQFFDFVGTSVRPAGGSVTLLVFSSHDYSDARDPAFVFGGLTYPGDGFVNAPSSRSIYGTADRKTLLQGTVVHWSLSGSFASELVRTRVRRFWKVELEGMSAVLATFAASADEVVDRALAGASEPVTSELIDAHETELTMHSIVQVAHPSAREECISPTKPERAGAAADGSAAQPTTPPTTEPVSATQAVASAISALPTSIDSIDLAAVWTTQVAGARGADVDVYLRPAGSPVELCYRATSTPDGRCRYLRDIREAAPGIDDHRWVATWEVVQLDPATSLDESTCWLNLFKGTDSPISGIVRLAIDGKAATTSFSFPAGPGNHGGNAGTRETDPNWIRIDLTSLRSSAR